MKKMTMEEKEDRRKRINEGKLTLTDYSAGCLWCGASVRHLSRVDYDEPGVECLKCGKFSYRYEYPDTVTLEKRKKKKS